MKQLLIFIIFLNSFISFAQIERVEPPNWWVGFKNQELQLLVYGKNIGNSSASISYDGVSLQEIHRADSPNYLFLDLLISENAKPGTLKILFKSEKGKKSTFTYELKQRHKSAEAYVGFDSSDAIYLITPDRFANGDVSNDIDRSLREKSINRKDDYARHGGDIRGIIDHLDYIDEMGFTAIWPTPLLINDMKTASYHGYAMTDFYQVDPRFGSLNEYKELADKSRDKGIKLIMDMVANHVGVEHWWIKDLPFSNWINFQERFENKEGFVQSNHRRTTNQDKYASKIDKKGMTEGWFVETMPDLNQRNPYLAKYLIQNSIWWVETLELGGIRQDTYPYPDKEFMSDWAGAIMNEYPNLSIVGEEWSTNPLLIGYWQEGANNRDGYDSNLKSSMDFAMQVNIVKGLNEEEAWAEGLFKIYEGLSNDFIYACPEAIMVFPDNHDMSRIFTQLQEHVVHTKMAVAYMLMMPRIPQMYYGTEILMNDTANPGDHGLIRTDFPGGWENDPVNAFTGKGLSEDQIGMQKFVKTLLNFRKDSQAIHNGRTVHFAPENGTYLLARMVDDEKVIIILNKNEKPVELELDRFKELELNGKELKNVISGEKVIWKDSLLLEGEGAFIFTTKL